MAADYLQSWTPSLFPSYFGSLLHPFFCSLLPLDPDSRIEATHKAFPVLLETMLGPIAGAAQTTEPRPRSNPEAPQGSRPF